MYDNSNEIITCSSTKSKEVKEIEKAIEKLKIQEKRLVDLYLSSTLDVETINHKNDVIKKEIDKLTKKKTTLDPDNDFKEYTVELLKKLDYEEDNGDFIFKNNLSFTYLFDSLNRKAQKELINRLISSIEITRDDNYNIEIKNIKFTEEFISKSTKDYIDYLNELLTDNNIGITYKKQVNKEKLLELEKDYTIMSLVKMENNQYTEEELNNYIDLMKEHFYTDGIINCPYIEGNNNVLVMCDCSGSMFWGENPPISTSISLGIYFAERNNGPFKDLIMTFSSNPMYVDIGNEPNLLSKVKKIFASASRYC